MRRGRRLGQREREGRERELIGEGGWIFRPLKMGLVREEGRERSGRERRGGGFPPLLRRGVSQRKKKSKLKKKKGKKGEKKGKKEKKVRY